MTTIEIALRPGEQIIRQFSISLRFFILLIAAGLFLAVFIPVFGAWLFQFIGFSFTSALMTGLIAVGLLVGLALILYALYFRAARQYALTNQRFIETLGLFSKRTVSADYEQVTDITVEQDVFERLILDAGYVGINTAGSDQEEIQLERIAKPYLISNQLRELCETRLHELGIPEAGTAPVLRAGLRTAPPDAPEPNPPSAPRGGPVA